MQAPSRPAKLVGIRIIKPLGWSSYEHSNRINIWQNPSRRFQLLCNVQLAINPKVPLAGNIWSARNAEWILRCVFTQWTIFMLFPYLKCSDPLWRCRSYYARYFSPTLCTFQVSLFYVHSSREQYRTFATFCTTSVTVFYDFGSVMSLFTTRSDELLIVHHLLLPVFWPVDRFKSASPFNKKFFQERYKHLTSNVF